MSRTRALALVAALGIASVVDLTPRTANADVQTASPWALGAAQWTRWAPAPYSRWDVWNDLAGKVQIVAEPGNKSAVFFLNGDGSVHYRNVDQGVNADFPGIAARQIAVGAGGRLWAITRDGKWARWAPAPYTRWDVYNDLNGKLQLVGDPLSPGGVFFVLEGGGVGYRDVDRNVNLTFPGVRAKHIAVGQGGRLWAITQNGRWARWAPAPYNRWDVYNDLKGKVQLVGDPLSQGGVYFRNADGSVHYRNVDANINVDFPGWVATDLTVSDVAP